MTIFENNRLTDIRGIPARPGYAARPQTSICACTSANWLLARNNQLDSNQPLDNRIPCPCLPATETATVFVIRP